MSEDIHARGAILIDPPLTWSEVGECPDSWWDPGADGVWRDALLRATQTKESTPTGVIVRRTADAIIPADLIGWNLTEHVQEIVDRFAGSRTFTGYFECTYARGEDVWRLAVRDGRVVEVRPTWPDDAAGGAR